MPRVTVGIPVYNGAQLLAETLDCLRRQSFGDFVVNICDNASTDATPEICAAYARRDSRFRHIRHETNIGALPNFMAARDSAETELFMWRAFDDLSDDNYIEELVAVHDRHPGTMLAVSNVVRIYGPGRPPRQQPYDPRTETLPRLWRLYRQILRNSTGWYYGLWNRAALVDLTNFIRRHFPDEWAFDQIALGGAALQGGIRGTTTTTFHKRLLDEARGYIPRKRPGRAEMTARNRRFRQAAHALIAASSLSAAEKAILHAATPWYAHRRCHSWLRILRAALAGR